MALRLGLNDIYRDELTTASARTGIGSAALAALIDAEAAKQGGVWQPDSFNATSKAAGLTQFLASTWIEQAERVGTLLNETAQRLDYLGADGRVVAKHRDALLALRFEPLQAIVAAAEYGVANLAILARRGVLPEGISDDDRAGYMYLAHHEGPGGAVAFLSGKRRYTRANLVGQVGTAAGDRLIAGTGGDANQAYRDWLLGYIERKIVPARFREPAAATPVGT